MSRPLPAPSTLGEALRAVTTMHPDSPAVTDLGGSGAGRAATYGDLHERSRRTAAFLHDLGVRRGDAVATLLPNCLEWLDVFFAAAHLGALLVPLNTRYR